MGEVGCKERDGREDRLAIDVVSIELSGIYKQAINMFSLVLFNCFWQSVDAFALHLLFYGFHSPDECEAVQA